MDLLWPSYEPPMSLLWTSYGPPMDLLPPMSLPSTHYVPPMNLLWPSYGPPMTPIPHTHLSAGRSHALDRAMNRKNRPKQIVITFSHPPPGFRPSLLLELYDLSLPLSLSLPLPPDYY